MNWLRVLNVSGEESRRAKLLIEGVIGGYDFFDDSGQTAAEFIRTVDALGEVDEIDVDLNSPGGVVSDGIAIANYLVRHQAQVTINVIGEAASIASVILQAADPGRRHMALGTTVFVHDPLTIAIGDADDFRDIADTLDTVRDSIVELFTRHNTISADDAREMMSNDTTLTAEQTLDAGIADTMDETLQAVACFMDHSAALEQARKTMMRKRSKSMPQQQSKLAAKLGQAIKAITNNSKDPRGRDDVVSALAAAAGATAETVNQVLNDKAAPTRSMLSAFASVEGMPEESEQVSAAEEDGHTLEDASEPEPPQGGEPLDGKPAPALDVVRACNKAGVPHLAEGMIEAGVTKKGLTERLNVAGKIKDICAAAGVEARADRYIKAGMGADEVRQDLWDLVVARDGEGTDHHVPTNRRPPIDTGEVYKRYNNQARQR